MLAAAHRLRRRAEFAATLRTGRRAARGAVVVSVALPHPARRGGIGDPGSGLAEAPVQAGFIVSRSVGGAVVRNAVKRRLRHLVAQRMNTLPAGTSLVVRALPAAAERGRPELAADLDAALASALRSRAGMPGELASPAARTEVDQ